MRTGLQRHDLFDFINIETLCMTLLTMVDSKEQQDTSSV